jgi:hypothetical protein
MLSEISQTQRQISHFPLIFGVQIKKKNMKVEGGLFGKMKGTRGSGNKTGSWAGR